MTVGEALLTPTRIYVRGVLEALRRKKDRRAVLGLAHITGGGLAGNLERILPEGCQVEIDRGSWTPLPVFGWLQRLGNIDRAEMERVFNMGIGFVLVVRERAVAGIQERLAAAQLESRVIGKVTAGDRAVTYTP